MEPPKNLLSLLEERHLPDKTITLAYTAQKTLSKIQIGLDLLKRQSWPPLLEIEIQSYLKEMDSAYQAILRHTHADMQDRHRTVFWENFEKVLQILDQSFAYIDNFKGLEEIAQHQHDQNLQEFSQYHKALQLALDIPKNKLQNPQIDTYAVFARYRVQMDPKTRQVELQLLALQWAFECQKQSLNLKSFRMFQDIPEPDRTFVSKKVEEWVHAKPAAYKKYQKSANKAFLRRHLEAAQIQKHIHFLQGKRTHASSWRPGAMLTYMQALLDKYLLPYSLASQSRQKMIFSAAVQDVHKYAHHWKGPGSKI